MKPIQIEIHGVTSKSSEEICAALLDTERWSDFGGYSILPGIKHAHFEIRTPEVLGSRIIVQNTDGSAHIEEIVEWDPAKKVILKFQAFTPPLKNIASHFIETWEFERINTETHTKRSMSMYPNHLFGWLILLPISRLMKKAFEQNAKQFS
ncbi:MAG TPA: hypothetical protein PLG52_07835 [Anaerolineales bacterium]|nr:hypothetical protein [Anaerolineales bacterium]